MIAYRAMLDVPRELVAYVARLLADERRARGTRRGSRALTCWRQALFALVWFRKREDIAVLGAGFGISRATAYRYHDEAVSVLAAQAPQLPEALQRVQSEGWTFVILDGKVVDTDRCAETKISKKGKVIDAWYAGKTHDFGGNVQAVMRPDGLPIWVSEVEPGSAHDLTVARQHALGALYAAAARGLPTLADPGYDGAGIGVHTPLKQPADGRQLDVDTRTYNMLLRSLRCLGERGLALLTQGWRALQHVTASPSRIGDLAKAALVLTHFEHRYLSR
ncbi:transposase family protein [Dactylosporangium sp. NPDC049742]|uniref:transposase family protein n=1 Tax=Dactylosporangium sp. NPDC049742 TaxID=3154737 RepID=UPI0034266978